MPSLYAHYLLGQQSLSKFQPEILKAVTDYRAAFNLGLQGPDFLFFKNFGADKDASALSSQIHKTPFKETLDALTRIYKQAYKSQNEQALSYITGFIGHFALDTNGHEYVNYAAHYDNISHMELEAEFDKFLIRKQGLDPFLLDQAALIRADGGLKNLVSELFSDFSLSKNEIERSISDFIKAKKYIVFAQRHVPFLIEPCLKMLGVYEFAKGFYYKRKDNAALRGGVLKLFEKYNLALEIYPKLAMEYVRFLDGGELGEYFDRDFEVYKYE